MLTSTTRKKGSGAKVLLPFFLSLWLLGCQSSQQASPWAYEHHIQTPKPGIQDNIIFLEARLKKRPRAYLEQAELAGLYLQRAKSGHHDHQDIKLAKSWLQRSLAEFESPQALIVQADYFQMVHQFPESLENLNKALKLDPKNLGAQALKARVCLAKGDIKQAEQVLAPLAGSPLASIIFLQGQLQESLKHTDKARELYRRAISLEASSDSPSESARMRAVLARLEMKVGRDEQAWPLLEAALSIPVDQPLTSLLKADWLYRNSKEEQAKELLRSGHLRYHDPRFLLRLGEFQQELGETGLAKRSWLEASEELRHHLLGHEWDLALALFYLSPQGNAEEIRELMTRELERRQDPETLRIRDLVIPQKAQNL